MLWFKPKLDATTSADIIVEFAKWMHDEFAMYEGNSDGCMLKNIATTHPSVFNEINIGNTLVERYFVMSNTADQRVATRLCIFVSKLNIIFGKDIIDQFKERCITSMIEDLHINVDNLTAYFKLSNLFWTYPILIMMGTLDMKELIANIGTEE